VRIFRVISLAALSLCFVPSIGFAESFWLHKQILGTGTHGAEAHFAAIDSSDCIMANTPDFEILTRDCWKSWNYVIVDSPKYPLRKYSFAAFVHPSHNLILIGCNDNSVGHIVRSTDGGATWKDTTIGSYVKNQPINFITAMAARDSSHIVVLMGADSTYFSDHLMLSSDGGVTWQSVMTPKFLHDSPQDGTPPNPILSYLAPNTLIVAACNSDTDYNCTFYQTTNLGVTWNSGFIANTTITKFAFINPNLGFASGTLYDLSAKTETATIDKTTDGGATWTNIFSKQIIVSPDSYYKATGGLWSLAFADSIHGIACGDWGLILRTTDGGATWTQMSSDYTDDVQGKRFTLRCRLSRYESCDDLLWGWIGFSISSKRDFEPSQYYLPAL